MIGASDFDKRLKNTFESVAICYIFLKNNFSVIKIPLLQSLAASMKRTVNYLELVQCSVVAPDLVKIDEEILEITLSLKRKRSPKQSIKLIKELTDIFNLTVDKYWLDNPAVEELLSLSTNLNQHPKGIDLFLEICTKNYIFYSLPKQNAKFGQIDLSPKSKGFLLKLKISNLYSHQVKAIEAIRSNYHTVISTSTSSGKSLIYQLPILESIEKDSESCFLLLFPTKALAQDQKERFNTFPFTNAATYDGDTIKSERITIRNTCNILLTNPDMLHVSILPHHNLWIRFLVNLKIVMIDEIHCYYDEFGAHLRLLLLRLKRICSFYGNTGIIFLGCSATIPNPRQHFGNLIYAENCTSQKFESRNELIKVVDSDGSACEEKTCIVWRPSNSSLNISSIDEAIRIVANLCRCEIKALVFVKSRQQCEVLFKEVIKNPSIQSKVIAYRGGYSASERRLIEKQIYANKVLIVISTNALELGIDIGNLDCVVHLGFPSTVSSFHQQSGRAGRRLKKSLDIFIPEPNTVDQYYANNLDLLIPCRNKQSLQISHNNDIVKIHLNCAAQELPITRAEDVFFGQGSIYSELCISSLRYDEIKNNYIPLLKYDNNPSLLNPIRKIPKIIYELIDIFSRELLESITIDRVPFTLYKQAIHILKGQSYLIIDVFHERHIAVCKKINVDYITSPEKYYSFEPIYSKAKYLINNLDFNCGVILKTITSFGYNIVDPKTKAVKETIENVKKDALSEVVDGVWIKVPMEYKFDFSRHNKGVHSLQHVIVKLFPIYTTAFVRSCCCGSKKTKLLEYIMVYNQIVIGEAMKIILMKCEDILTNCFCVDGCESCIYIDSCAVHNTFLSRAAALVLFRILKSKLVSGDDGSV